MTYYVCSRCWGGGNNNYIAWNFSGTRWQCKKFIRSRGGHSAYFITQIQSMDEVRRRYAD